MRRTVLAILFLLALAGIVWWGARWMAMRDELEATVIFEQADELRPGSLVVSDSLVIGEVTKVTPLQGRDAVSLRIDAEHRSEVLVDSRYSIEGTHPNAVLRVHSMLAFGRPVQEGDVLIGRQSALARWLQKGEPLIERVKSEAARLGSDSDLAARLEKLRQDLPGMKESSESALQERLAGVADEVNELERKMREQGREIDAQKLRADFDRWVAEAKKAVAEREVAAPSPR
ncbi:MAG TPA: hypothetical protein VM557_08390 [Thermoanaerobaculia bacterium]|nr:hypothetical protein [Thermoanaerobaculia bacterium]